MFRIRIRLDPDSNRQSGSGSGFGIRIRIQQLKLSFFKAVEGCTDRVGTSKHLFAGGGEGCEVCVFVCLSSYQLAVMYFFIIHVEIWQPFCSANSKIQVNKYHTGRNPQIFLNCLSKCFFFTWIRIRKKQIRIRNTAFMSPTFKIYPLIPLLANYNLVSMSL